MSVVRRLPLLTTSEIRTFQACKRLHHYSYQLLVRPVRSSSAMVFGTLVHAGRESLFLNWKAGERSTLSLSHALEDVAKLAASSADPVDPYELVKVEELIRGYYFRWSDAPYDVLDVEREFRAPLLNPETGARSRSRDRGGKIDAIVRERIATGSSGATPGRVLVNELKTSSEDITIGSLYWRRLRLDPQVSNYFVGARALGYDPAACQYDVVHKPTIKPAKATPVEAQKFRITDGALYAGQRLHDEDLDDYRARLREDIASKPDTYYVRGEVVRFERDELDAAADAWSVAQEMRDAARTNRYPRNPDACTRYGRTCDFFDVCTNSASIEDPSKFRRATTAHEELSASAPTAA